MISTATCASTGGSSRPGPGLLDYVVVHELAHLRHKDHTKGYWALVGKTMPDYEERKANVRGVGVDLLW